MAIIRVRIEVTIVDLVLDTPEELHVPGVGLLQLSSVQHLFASGIFPQEYS